MDNIEKSIKGKTQEEIDNLFIIDMNGFGESHIGCSNWQLASVEQKSTDRMRVTYYSPFDDCDDQSSFNPTISDFRNRTYSKQEIIKITSEAQEKCDAIEKIESTLSDWMKQVLYRTVRTYPVGVADISKRLGWI